MAAVIWSNHFNKSHINIAGKLKKPSKNIHPAMEIPKTKIRESIQAAEGVKIIVKIIPKEPDEERPFITDFVIVNFLAKL